MNNLRANKVQNHVQIEQSVHKLPANYQTGGYKFRPMSGWNGTVGSRLVFQFITHSLNPLKHDEH